MRLLQKENIYIIAVRTDSGVDIYSWTFALLFFFVQSLYFYQFIVDLKMVEYDS